MLIEGDEQWRSWAIDFFNGSRPSHCHSTSTVTLGKYYFPLYHF